MKVIGYFAYSSPEAVVCSGKACVISGSESAMRQYISEQEPKGGKRHTIRKTRFGEFLPLGRQAGLALADANFKKHKKRFLTVQIKPR